MFNFFNSIADYLKLVGDVILNWLHSLIDLLLAIPRMLEFLSLSFGYLPTFVAPFALLIVAFSIVYFVAGRKGDS